MTSQRVQNVMDASCGFMCGFFFMAFVNLKGHLSDACFVGSLSALSLSFGFSLIQHLRRMPAQDKKYSFCIGAFVPLSALLLYCSLMAISSYNPEPKPTWMLAALAMSLGIIATRTAVAVAPSVATSIERSLLRR